MLEILCHFISKMHSTKFVYTVKYMLNAFINLKIKIVANTVVLFLQTTKIHPLFDFKIC